VTSPPFQVKVGAASALAFTVQPGATQAGVATTAQVTVTDAWGNKVATGAQTVELSLADNPGSAILSGTMTVTAKAGVADFADIRIDRASSGYRLKASATGLTDGASDPFDVTFAKATRLVVTGQPSDAVAGVPLAPAVTLEVQDEFGNLVADDASLVTVALGTNAGGATLGGQTGVEAVNGKITLDNLLLDRTGVGYTLSVSCAGLAGALTLPFDVLPSLPTRLIVVTQPSDAVAGATMQPGVQIAVQDAYGNNVAANVAVTLSIGANPGGASLSGTTTVTVDEGLATFSNLQLDRAATGYTLVANSPGLIGMTTSTFDVTFAPAARLAFEIQPAGGLAGTLLDPPLAVRIEDAFGNTVTTADDLVSIRLAENPGGGVLGGTTNVKALAGIAVFGDLQIDKAGKGYAVKAESVGLVPAQSQPFDIASGTPTQLRIVQQPTDVKAGAPIQAAIQVAVLDAAGNAVTGATTQVTVTIGSNPGGASLIGQTTATAVGGVATFDDVRLDRADSGYTLVVSASQLASDTSIPFTVGHGTAARLAFVTAPGDTTAGQALQSVSVAVEDSYGNAVLDAAQPVSLGLAATTEGVVLAGTVTVTTVAGRADFVDLTVDKAGSGFALTAQAPGLQGALSAPFAVTPGAAARLVFSQQPSSSVAGTPLTPAAEVRVEDAFGNATLTSDQAVTLSLGQNPGGAALLGAASVATVAGKATFADIAVDKVGSGYTLLASSGGLQGAQSQAFDVTFTLPTALAIATEPTTTVAGLAMDPALRVNVVDGFGNVVQGVSTLVTVAIQTNPGDAKLLGTATVAAIDGVATFADVRLDKAAVGYTLVASAGSLSAATTKPFDVVAGAGTHLAIAQQPSGGVAAKPLSPGLAVAVLDAFDNPVHDATNAVHLALLPTESTAPLGGTLEQLAVNGRASFDDLHIDKTGVYALAASAPGLTGIATTDITIQAGSPFALSFVVQPTSVAAGAIMQPAVQVLVLDASGNPVGSATNTIALQIANNPAGAALLGNSGVAAQAGTATFEDVRLDRAGDGYTLTAVADGLASATSTPFGVTAGIGARLVFLEQPSAAVAGAAFDPPVKVGVVDAYGNAVTGEAHAVQLGVAQGPVGSALAGSPTADIVGGAAVFADAALPKAGTGYVLGAMSPGLADAASAPFAVTFGAAAKLGFVTEPVDGVIGVPLNPAVQVSVQDAFGNTVTTASAEITIGLQAGAPAATMTGTTLRSTNLGVATFADLQLDQIGTGYALQASANALESATSAQFAMAAAGNLRLSFTVAPTSATAGEALTGIEVTVLDSLDNVDTTATTPITIAVSNNPGGATLAGTKTLVPTGGKATFTDLSLDKAGTDYTLLATQAGTTAGVSPAFDIAAAAPARLLFLSQPGTATSGTAISPAIQVAIADANGNVIAGATDDVTVSLAQASTEATLSGATTAAANGGIAQFGSLAVDKAGSGYALVAKSTGLATATSDAFQVVPGAASQLRFAVQPAGVVAGTAMAPSVQVVVRDANGNTVTGATPPVTLAVGLGPVGAALTGTTTVATTNGTATFANVVLTRAGSGYTLQASAGGLQGDTSATFDVNPATASQLAFVVQPGATAAGSNLTPAPQVAVQDAFGNTVPTATTVSLELGTNPSGGALLSGSTAATNQGVATFAGTALDKAGNGYALKASASGLESATSMPFNIAPGAASRLVFAVQPSTTQAGAAMSPAVKVLVQDQWGNLVTSASSVVGLAIAQGNSGATLLTGASATVVSGVATFGNVSVDKAGTGLQLSATGTGLTAATSATFDVGAAAPARLAFVAQPTTTAAGANMGPAVQVAIQDNWGNMVSSATGQVSLAIANNAGGGTLSGTLTAAASGGIASFSNVRLDKAASGYTLGASSGSLSAATSSAFDVTFGDAARLAFSVQPVHCTAGSPITPAVKVAVQDAYGNLVLTATNSVSVGLGANPGGSTLAANTNAVAGIATFSDLSLGKVGNGYTLTTSSNGLTGTNSTAFNVTFGAPHHLAFAVQPADATAGAAISPVVKVAVLDANDNLVGTAATPVTIELSDNPGGSTFTATSSAAVAGVASFANLNLDKAGSGYRFSASAAGLAPSASGSFAITAAAPSKLAFTVQPVSGTAGTSLAALQVSVQDAFGNLVPTATNAVSLSLSTNPGGATLLTGNSATAAGGVATFGNLSLDKVASGYRLGAAAGGLSPATSDAFAITAGTAAKLAFVSQPSDVAAGANMASFKVAVQDTWGNTVPTATGTVALALSTNPSSATLLAGTTANAVNGIATFDAVQLDKVGSGYKLTATEQSWTSQASNAFAVTPGTATRLAFSVQPADVTAGGTMSAVKVVVQDAFGNFAPSGVQSITIGMANNPGGASVLTGATATTSGGTATFGNLTFDKAGTGYTLSATGPNLTGDTSAAFAISAGASQRLGFSVQPSDVAAGKPMAVVQVAVQDMFGNAVASGTQAIHLSFATNPTGASILTGADATAVAAVASFGSISLDKAGVGYKFSASASGLISATSGTFSVVGGDATKLVFAAQPAPGAAGATLAAVDVGVRDAWDNPVTTATPSITLALNANTLLGTNPVAAVAGVGHFADLKVNKVGTAYTLTASASGLSSATSTTFDITPGAPAALAFSVQPTTAAAGVAMTPAVQVTILDAYANPVTDAANTVTLAIGTNPSNGSLLDPQSAAAVGGVATFDGVRLDKVGTGYTLAAASAGLTGATSGTFNVAYGTAAKLVFASQPTTTVAGVNIANFAVNVLDTYGNLVANATNSVTLSLAANPGGGTLSGTQSVSASNGVAMFSGVKLQKAASGYQLAAAATGLAGGTSATFDVTFAAAAQLAFTRQPVNTAAGVALSPAIEVTVQDAFGNKVSNASNEITVGIGTNPSSGTLAGTLSKSAVAGVASFADVSVNKSGNGYTLTANSAPLTAGASSSFNVTPNTSLRLVFTTQPTTPTTAGTALGSVAVTVQDSLGNPVLTSSASITIAIATNPGNATLSGVKTVNASGGTATFQDLSLNKSGSGYTLQATSGGMTSGVSATFAISAAAATRLLFLNTPAASVAAGAPVLQSGGSPLQVAVVDAFDNTVPSATNSVTLALDTNTYGATLGGSVTASAVGGVASFGSASVAKAGLAYRLAATTGGLSGTFSGTFDILAAAAAKVAYNVQPSKTAAGAAMTPAVKLDIQDAYGNVVTNATNVVTLAVQSGPSGAVLTGGSAAASGGTAAFSNLTLDKAGTYTLAATSAPLSGATSFSFVIDPATATTLAVTTQPSTVQSGVAIAPAVVVAVQDNFGNTVASSTASVTLAISAGPGALTGGAALAAVAGLATFNNLKLDKVGSYRLQATSNGLLSVSTGQFDVTPGTPTRVVFKTQPSSAQAGAPLGNPTVEVRDAADNLCSSYNATIALMVTSGTGSGNLVGTKSVTAVYGVASFPSVHLTVTGAAYKLTASSGSLMTADSATFAVTSGNPYSLSYVQQPGNVAAGAAISPAVAVSVLDQWGNVVTNASGSVSMAVLTPAGNPLTGGGGTAPSSGVATFANLVLSKAASYTLRASYSGLTVDTATFTVSPAAASAARCTLTPSVGSATADGSASIGFTALIRDAYDNPISGQTIALFSNGANNSLTQFGTTNGSGTATASMTSTKAEGKTVSVLLNGTTLANTTVTFTAGAPNAAHCTLTPSSPSATANGVSSIALTATLRDVNDNPVPNYAVSLESTGNGTVMTQPVNTTAADGTTTGSMTSTKAEAKTVSATIGAPKLTMASTSVTFVAGTPDSAHSQLSIAPASQAAGATSSVTVTARDGFDNPVSGQTVTLSCTGNGNSLTQPTATTNASGSASGSIYSTKAESKTLTATIGSVATVNLPWTVVAAAVDNAHSTVSGSPGSATAGSGAISFTITVRDAYDNPISGANVTLASTGTDNAVTQPSSTTNASGVTTGSMTSTKAENKTVSATAGPGLGLPAGSTMVSFKAGAPANGHCALSPDITPQSVNGTIVLTATVRDAWNNPVPDVSVTLFSTGYANSYTQPSSATDSTGVTSGWMVSTKAEAKTVSLLIGGTAYASTNVTYAAGPAKQVVWGQQPGNTTAGAYFATPLTVEVHDAWDNLCTTSTASVTIWRPAGAAGLLGTLTVAAVGGVATFGDISVTVASASDQLAAGGANLSTNYSSLFSVSAGKPQSIGWSQQPTGTIAGTILAPTVAAMVVDGYGNRVTTETDTITLDLGDAPAGAGLGGGGAVTTAAGLASWPNAYLWQTGKYTLVAMSSTFGTTIQSEPFVIEHGTPYPGLSTLSATSGWVAAAPTTGITVTATLQDYYGNPVPDQVVSFSSSEQSDFFGTTSATDGNGMASIGLGSTKAGSRTVTAKAADGTTLASTTAFLNDAGTAQANTNLAVTPTIQYADGTSTVAITVTVADQFGNPVGDNVNVVVTGSGNTYGSVGFSSGGTFSTTLKSTKNEVKYITVYVGYDEGSGEPLATVYGTATFVAAPPVLSNLSVTTGACATINYTAKQLQGMPIDLVAEYSIAGANGPFKRCSQASVGNAGVAGVSATAVGVSHTFGWNTSADLGVFDGQVVVRLSPSSANGTIVGAPVSTTSWLSNGLMFGSSTNYGLANAGTRGIATADMNRDGYTDVVTANYLTSNVSILSGGSSGSLSLAGSYSAGGGSPDQIAVADFNKDGKTDVVVGDIALTGVGVMLNSGVGALGAPVRCGSNTTKGVATGDLDGDGDIDIVAAAWGASGYFVCTNNGSGSFTAGALMGGGGSGWSIALADLSGDGKLDLIYDGGSGSVRVGIGSGSGTFGTLTAYAGSGMHYALAVADIDRDGKLDVLGAGASNEVDIWRGNGDGTLAAKTTWLGDGTNQLGLAVGDYNGDGIPDIASAGSATNTVTFGPGRGDGTFGSGGYAAMGSSGWGLAIADINRDGKADVVLGNSSGTSTSVKLNATASACERQLGGTIETAVGLTPNGAVMADFNGDGKPDAAVANAGAPSFSLLFGSGNGGFTAPVTYALSASRVGAALAAFDLDADGDQDLAVAQAGSSSELITYTNNGSGVFTNVASSTIGSVTPVDMGVGYFNGDAKPDIAILTADSLIIYKNNASNVLTQYMTYMLSPSVEKAQRLAVTEVNQDTYSDIAVANNAQTGAALYIGAGNFGFNPLTPSPNIGPCRSVAAMDANGDGKNDLLFANGSNVRVILNNGTGNWVSGSSYTTGLGASSSLWAITAGDFNGDGVQDIATAGYDGGTSGGGVAILPGAGDGTFGTPTTYAAPRTTVDLVAADTNGDGRLDVGCVNQSADTFGMLLSSGATGMRGALHLTAPDAYGLTVADFNRDGRLDFAATRAVAAGAVTVLNSSGTSYSAGVQYATSASTPQGVCAVDWNVDGKLDLVTAHAGAGGYAIHSGDGTGLFSYVGSYYSNNFMDVATGDFNQDGKPDVVLSNDMASGTDYLSIVSGPGALSGGSISTVGVGALQPRGLAVADYNMDGKPDIAVANLSSNVTVAFNAGLGVFTTSSYTLSGGFILYAAAGDVTGDGKPDIVATNSAAPGNFGVFILTNTNGGGASAFSVGAQIPLGKYPTGVKLADMNGDGKLDIVIANYYGFVTLGINGGSGTFTNWQHYGGLGGVNWALQVGDFNRDGIFDAATSDNGTGSVSVLYGR